MLKWGILATGGITKKFAEALIGLYGPGCIEAVASRNEDRAKAFALEHQVKKAYGSYEALCQDPEVDVIYIATPNNLHFENAMLCLNNGKHVLCEKPFTTNRQDAELLFTTAEEKGLFIMEAFWIKHLPLLKKLETILATGIIGDICHLRADYGFIAPDTRKQRKFDSALGGGALLDIGIYNLGFAKIVMKDQPEDIKSKVIMNEYGTDEYSTMILSYPGNKTAVLTTSIGLALGTGGAIYGTKGSIHFPNYQKAEIMEIRPNDEPPYQIKMPFEINGFEYQIRETEACITAGQNTSKVLTKADTLEIMGTMDEIRKSWGMKFAFEEN